MTFGFAKRLEEASFKINLAKMKKLRTMKKQKKKKKDTTLTLVMKVDLLQAVKMETKNLLNY